MTGAIDSAQIMEALDALRQELALLSARMGALEAAAKVQPLAAVPPQSPLPVQAEVSVLSEEVLLVISAAIAAFLGKKPRIRQIRLLGATSWAQQGRVTIQTSHAVPVHHG